MKIYFFKKNKKIKNKGMTLVEILVIVSILILIVIAVSSFQSDIFKFNKIISSGLNTQQSANKVLRPFAAEVRSATISNIGGYPIESASSTSLVFYSDADSDGLKERIRYFLEDGKFKKGTIVPSGNPYVYNHQDEKIKTIIDNVLPINNIFEYYDGNYNGTSSSVPLSYPIEITDITLVKISVLVDEDPNQPPNATEFSTQVVFRNLKDR